LRNAWLGHHSYCIIDNSAKGGWPAKLERIWENVLHFLGKSDRKRYFKKYLLATKKNEVPKVPDNLVQEEFELEETFLNNEDPEIEEKVVKRTQKGINFYSHFIRGNKVRSESEGSDIPEGREKYEILRSGAYLQLLERADESRIVMKKVRKYFIWERMNLFIDTFVNGGGFSVLYVDGDRDIKWLKLPEGVEVEKEVTLHKDYSAYHLSKSLNK